MKLFGRLVGAVVVTGAGVAYYAYRKHCDTGQSYFDIVKQLPGEVQRRATEAVSEGMAAARRRDQEMARQLQAGTPTPPPAGAATFGAADVPPPPTASSGGADGEPFSTSVSAVS